MCLWKINDFYFVFHFAIGCVTAALEEVPNILIQVTGRHVRRLAECTCVDPEQKIKTTEELIGENNDTIFDAQQMMLDWLNKDNGSETEKLSELRKFLQSKRNGKLQGV